MKLRLSKRRSPRRSGYLLKKDEKKALLDMLSDLASNCSDVVSAVVNVITKEDHIHLYKEREKIWSSLQSAQPLMSTLD